MDTMSYKGQTTTLEERVTIAERVRAGQSSREIATEMGRPLATVRKGGKSICGKGEQACPARWVGLLLGRWSRSAWITTALFTITRAPRLFQASSIKDRRWSIPALSAIIKPSLGKLLQARPFLI
jgi:hypothetical protein